MRSTITARGQTVVPVALHPIAAFRGSGGGGGTARLLEDRALDRQKEER